MNQPLSIHQTQFQISDAYKADELKYRVCLSMVHHIIRRDIGIQINPNTFNLFADVAHFIDLHLDDISRHDKLMLSKEFDQLFNEIETTTHYVLFHHQICAFLTKYRIDVKESHYGLQKVFNLVQHCSDWGLLEELKIFATRIIECAVNKHEAGSSKEVRKILQEEGQAAISFLKAWLRRDGALASTHLEKCFSYLTKLECTLNLADDMLDVSQDVEKGLIAKNFGFGHRLYLAFHILKNASGILISRPFSFLSDAGRFVYRFLR